MVFLTVEEFYSYKSLFQDVPEELNKYRKKKPVKKSETSWLLVGKNDEAKSLLNKLTTSNIDSIYAELVKLETKQIMDALIDKVLLDQKFIRTYALLCIKMASVDAFRVMLIEKTHNLFMLCVNLKELPMPQFKNRTQVLNCVEFIGELYNVNLLSHKIMRDCYTLLIGRSKSNKIHGIEMLYTFTKSNHAKFCLVKPDAVLLKSQISSITVNENKDKYKLMDTLELL